MKISNRLKTVCDMVENKASVIDVACDHGYAGIYLNLYKDCEVICSDINQNALSSAINNVKEYKLENNIKTIIADGVEGIDIKDKTILLCGIGLNTTIDIINNIKTYNMKEIIIGLNSDWDKLREFMFNKKFIITDEKYVYEKGKHYVIIKFIIGNKKYLNDDILIGPILKYDREYLKYLLNNYTKINDSIPPSYKELKKELAYKIEIINKYI